MSSARSKENTISLAGEERIVAFVDILGFKELIKSWDSDEKILEVVETAFRNATAYVGGKYAMRAQGAEDWRLRLFSDCACISQPATALGMMRLLEGVALFQRTMITNGFLVRGGISIGQHYESAYTIMSRGLLDAHELEQDASGLPRILISANVLRFIEAEDEDDVRSEIKEFVTFENRREAFLCYLIFEEEDEWLGGEPFYARQHDLIVQALASPNLDARTRFKYAWLAEYHNWSLSQVARVLKTTGVLMEDEVWHLNLHWVDGVKVPRRFSCARWTDRSLPAPVDGNDTKGVDWVREWPGMWSEDDQMEDS